MFSVYLENNSYVKHKKNLIILFKAYVIETVKKNFDKIRKDKERKKDLYRISPFILTKAYKTRGITS